MSFGAGARLHGCMNGLIAPPLPKRRELHGLSAPPQTLRTRKKLPEGQHVWLMFESNDLGESVADLCLLAQVRPIWVQQAGSLDNVAKSQSLLITDSPDLVSESLAHLPRIVVAPVAQAASTNGVLDVLDAPDVALPGDEVALVKLVEQWAHEGSDEKSVFLVAGWRGGGGATTTALNLARQLGAAMLDASGNYAVQDLMRRGSEAGAVGWADLEVGDLPSGAELVAALARLDTVPVLTALEGPPVVPCSPVVEAVAMGLPRDVVIDCGSMIGQAVVLQHNLELAGADVRLILVGRSAVDQQDSLAHTLFEIVESGDESLDSVFLLINGRPNDLFRAVVARFQVQWRRLPRRSSVRGWTRVVSDLGSGIARRE